MSSAFSFSTADLRRPTTNRLASSRLSDNFFDIYSCWNGETRLKKYKHWILSIPPFETRDSQVGTQGWINNYKYSYYFSVCQCHVKRQTMSLPIVNDNDSYSWMAFIDEVPVLFRVDRMWLLNNWMIYRI